MRSTKRSLLVGSPTKSATTSSSGSISSKCVSAGSYTLAHWQAFHRRIFGGLYPWAGELRTVQIAKPNAFYARPEHIANYAQGIFVELAKERHLVGLDRETFLQRLTHYHAEMYAVHPFREGNTRSLRTFLGQLAVGAGHRVDWEHLDHKRSFDANVQSLNGKNEQLRELRSRSSIYPLRVSRPGLCRSRRRSPVTPPLVGKVQRRHVQLGS